MKRHITAALTISALALASCGTQKEAAEAAAPAPVVKEVHEMYKAFGDRLILFPNPAFN